MNKKSGGDSDSKSLPSENMVHQIFTQLIAQLQKDGKLAKFKDDIIAMIKRKAEEERGCQPKTTPTVEAVGHKSPRDLQNSASDQPDLASHPPSQPSFHRAHDYSDDGAGVFPEARATSPFLRSNSERVFFLTLKVFFFSSCFSSEDIEMAPIPISQEIFDENINYDDFA